MTTKQPPQPCPMPTCEGELTEHCAPAQDGRRKCYWLRCPTCKTVIDTQGWRAFSETTGKPATLPPKG